MAIYSILDFYNSYKGPWSKTIIIAILGTSILDHYNGYIGALILDKLQSVYGLVDPRKL
jgi:hypothetical protein